MLFVNLSNHPSRTWSEEQQKAASIYGAVQDIAFPPIDALKTKKEVVELAEEYAKRINTMNPTAVMVQGEFTFTYHVVKALKAKGITVVAACSERLVTELDGRKVVEFKFEQFREY